jgi:hypothetical protein
MRSGIILCCLAAAGLWGCTNTYQLWRESPEAISSRLRKLQGKTVDLALTNGSTHEHVTVNFFGDSVGFQREDPPEAGVVSITSVVSVSRPGGVLGPVLGLVGGALVGGAIGGAAATGGHEEPKNTGEAIAEAFTVPMNYGAGVLVGGCIGGAVGLAIGALAGSGEMYVLDPGPFSGGGSSRMQRCVVRERTLSGDTVTLGVAMLLEETPTKITIRWRGEAIVLGRPPVELIRREGMILIIVPEKLLN